MKFSDTFIKLRKEAGYTQKQIAELLYVTDKAVSKWERGLGMPDLSLLTKISRILDCDVEILISGIADNNNSNWQGLLYLDVDASTMVGDKTITDIMLSYFLLVGITEISIITNKKNIEYLKQFNKKNKFIKITYTYPRNGKTMIVYDSFFLFGANITRWFQSCIAMDKNVALVLDGRDIPIIFSQDSLNIEVLLNVVDKKKLGRGIIYFPMKNKTNIKDIDGFISSYQKYHSMNIYNIEEIANTRKIK